MGYMQNRAYTHLNKELISLSYEHCFLSGSVWNLRVHPARLTIPFRCQGKTHSYAFN